MLIEITGDEELKRLLGIDSGFLLDVDYQSNSCTIHKINCRLSNPETNASLSPSDKKQNNKGEIWFSNKRPKILSKANELSEKGLCSIALCKICKP